jgi:hypothetical protein
MELIKFSPAARLLGPPPPPSPPPTSLSFPQKKTGLFKKFPGVGAEEGAFINKRKFKDNPGRKRIFDQAFAKFEMNGAEAAVLFREYGKMLGCSRQALGGWLNSAWSHPIHLLLVRGYLARSR